MSRKVQTSIHSGDCIWRTSEPTGPITLMSARIPFTIRLLPFSYYLPEPSLALFRRFNWHRKADRLEPRLFRAIRNNAVVLRIKFHHVRAIVFFDDRDFGGRERWQ